MIISRILDVEIFPNLFSATFIDLKSYLDTFADCVNEKGKPIPITEKLKVSEIKRRLDTVKTDTFYVSDKDDSQLLDLVAYINSMQSSFVTKTSLEGEIYQIPIRYDMFGFNIKGYDAYMIQGFMMKFNRFDSVKHLITYLHTLSHKIITLQQDRDLFYADKEIELLKNYRLPFAIVDVQDIHNLKSAGVIIDKNSGERIKYAKSLKQTSINLKWHELLDFRLPPITEEDAKFYNTDKYKQFTVEELNKLITNDFERYIMPDQIKPMLYYNRNDCFIVGEMVRQKPDEVRLRYSVSKAFGINALSSARSNMSDKLLIKFYSKFSGLKPNDFIKLRTERHALSFKKIIFPHIKFKTKQLQDLLEELKTVVIYRANKDSFYREINFYGTNYTIAAGGIHSKDYPGILKSDDKFTYIHWDYTSYYPSIMISYNIAPAHLIKKIFVKEVSYFKDTRVACKHAGVGAECVIAGVPNDISADIFKIVINAIYGKLGFEKFWLYDRLALLTVTINGQLMTLSLIEELELVGIHVISANTDGIIIKLPNDKREIFKSITDKWNIDNKMSADGEEYKMIVSRDVNNYFVVQSNDKLECHGALDPNQHIKNLSKGYDMPIVAHAVLEYFLHNTPIMETLHNHTDILDFCKTQNVGKQFNVVYNKVVDGKIVKVESQRHVRFYVSTKGFIIQKENITTGAKVSLASNKPVVILNSLDDMDISERNINYAYYYEECYKIIDPIKLGISSSQKANANNKTKSGKSLIKKYAKEYNSLFDDEQQ